jgi:hypothetical protein
MCSIGPRSYLPTIVREVPVRKKPSFYMFSYLIDAICSTKYFPSWVGTETLFYPIYIYIVLSYAKETLGSISMSSFNGTSIFLHI